MIWFILTIILLIGITIAIWRDSWNELGEKIALSVLAFIVAALLLIAEVLFGSLLTFGASVEYELYESNEIIALKDNQNITGSYFIFSGYVDEDLYYYYAENTDFGYKKNKVKAANCYIKYTDETPRIEKYKADFKNKAWYWLGAPFADDRIIIYCPQNTITTDFNIDLE